MPDGLIPSAIVEYVREHEKEILEEFIGLLRLPNDANIESDIRLNANRIIDILEHRGVAARLLETEEGTPSSLWRTANAWRQNHRSLSTFIMTVSR